MRKKFLSCGFARVATFLLLSLSSAIVVASPIPDSVLTSCNSLKSDGLDGSTMQLIVRPINQDNDPSKGVVGYSCIRTDGSGDPFYWTTFTKDGSIFGTPSVTCNLGSDSTGVLAWLNDLVGKPEPSVIEKMNSLECNPKEYINEIQKRAGEGGAGQSLGSGGGSEANVVSDMPAGAAGGAGIQVQEVPEGRVTITVLPGGPTKKQPLQNQQ